ncbi:MAG: hypothetical protein ACKKMS_01350 [Candidatus Nealsonbacteria bacterium]
MKERIKLTSGIIGIIALAIVLIVINIFVYDLKPTVFKKEVI